MGGVLLSNKEHPPPWKTKDLCYWGYGWVQELGSLGSLFQLCGSGTILVLPSACILQLFKVSSQEDFWPLICTQFQMGIKILGIIMRKCPHCLVQIAFKECNLASVQALCLGRLDFCQSVMDCAIQTDQLLFPCLFQNWWYQTLQMSFMPWTAKWTLTSFYEKRTQWKSRWSCVVGPAWHCPGQLSGAVGVTDTARSPSERDNTPLLAKGRVGVRTAVVSAATTQCWGSLVKPTDIYWVQMCTKHYVERVEVNLTLKG